MHVQLYIHGTHVTDGPLLYVDVTAFEKSKKQGKQDIFNSSLALL